MAVLSSDSNTIAVTGWPSIMNNEGVEEVFVSTDGGVTWKNMTSGLKEATGVVGKVRAGGLLLVDLVANNDTALLVSTSNGVMVTYMSSGAGAWNRFGGCTEFPIVLNAAISYEHYSDTLVAATFGRGVYRLHNAKAALLHVRQCVDATAPVAVPEETSAKFFPPQQ
jgi:hypothetical protein